MQTLINYIIRPKKVVYDVHNDLGPSTFLLDETHRCFRIDFDVKNRRGKILKCSIYHRELELKQKYPLMVYCHGNSGNRMDSFGPLYWILKNNICLLTFDFSGCGLSEGEFLSLGYYEQYDIEDVLKFVLVEYKFLDEKKIGLWGRSMGAVASILYAARTKVPSTLVLDSPFSDFPTLLRSYIDNFSIFSKIAGNYIYNSLRDSIHKEAFFDFEDLDPSKVIGQCQVPVFFIHGSKDTLIDMSHSQKLYEMYPNQKDKAYLEIESNHNDARPDLLYMTVIKFLRKVWLQNGPTKTYQDTISQLPTEPAKDTFWRIGENFSAQINPKRVESDFLNHEEEFSEKINQKTKKPLQFGCEQDNLSTGGSDFFSIKTETDTFKEAKSPDLETIWKMVNKLQEQGQQNKSQKTIPLFLDSFAQKRPFSLPKQTVVSCKEESEIENEEMLDSTGLETKTISDSFISKVAGGKFDLFRKNKKMS